MPVKKKKTSYINSGLLQFWEKSDQCYLFNDWIKCDHSRNLKQHFKIIKSSNFSHKEKATNEEFNFVKLKFDKYSSLLSKRLNEIHSLSYSNFFWKKTLSTGFIRTISFLYESFIKYENEFNFEKYSYKFLSEESYYSPNTFEDLRAFLSKNDWSNEQTFSVYLNCFFSPDKESEIKTSITENSTNFDFNVWLHNFKRKIYLFKKRFQEEKKDSIKTALLGCYFSKQNFNNLKEKSFDQVDEMTQNWSLKNSTYLFNDYARSIISEKEDDFDKFDIFFFKSLYSLFPKYLLESFEDNHHKIKSQLTKYPKLKTIISENWIGDSKNSLILALAKECFDIKLITNEHNCFFHIYEGNYSDFLVQLSDTFITLGWNSKNKKVLRGGSLYPFKLETNKIEMDVLFVAGGLLYKKPIFSSFYSNCGDSAIKSIEFNKTFFNYLDKSIIKKINYLSYPIKKISTLGIIKKEMFYNVKGLVQVKGSARKLMPKSRLVIIDYVSTSFIESIASDIPTIVFFDPNIKRLNKESINFFNSLIQSKIFQTNPKDAALHLNKIINNPEKWWNSWQVQKAKKDFLTENLNLDKLTNIILEINNNS